MLGETERLARGAMEAAGPYMGALQPYSGELVGDALMREAEQATCLSDWGGRRWDEDRFRHDLSILCQAIEEGNQLTPRGRSRSHCRLFTMLVSRLRYLDARNSVGGVDAERVVTPLIGTGMPRAGTTFLHGLISADPNNRAFPAWEAAIPAPLPDNGDRAALYAEILDFQGMTAPDVTAIHPFGSLLPEECIFIQESACNSLYGVYWDVAAFQAAVAGKAGMVYDWQVGIMQYLQVGQPSKHWALKGPGHLFTLPELLMAYPDARLYVNHRDPGKVIPSIASLFAKLRSLFSETAVDPQQIGQEQLAAWQHAMSGYTAWRNGEGADARVVDVRFNDLTADPLGTVERLYGELEIPLTPAAREAMARHLDADHHASAPKRPYTLAEYGLDEAAIESAFAPYFERFGIQREKRT